MTDKVGQQGAVLSLYQKREVIDVIKDSIDRKNKGEDLIEEIYGMKASFKDIRSVFSSQDPNIDYLDYVEELLFIMDKLEVLMKITKNEDAKKECRDLFMTIKEYKEKENIFEFEIKNKIILELVDLTSSNRKIYRSDILFGINNISKLLQINRKDIESIRDKGLIFYSKLSMGIKKEADISQEARLLVGKEILVNLLEYVLASYERSKLPFDFYEKIMIINILEEIRLTV